MKVEGLRIGDVTIEQIDLRTLTDDQIASMHEFSDVMRAEARPEDPPRPLELTIAGIRNIPDFVEVRMFSAFDAEGRIAASGEASWTKTEDNKHLLQVGVSVRADMRRRGIAKTLLGLLADVGEAEGRTLLMGGTSERIPAGEAFARAIGAEKGLEQHVNRLLLSEIDPGLVQKWIDEGPGRAPGYSLLEIDGPYPAEKLDAIVDMHQVMNTAPRDDLDMEDFSFTAEHALAWEKSMAATGDERWSLFAIHDATGQIAGFTETLWNPKMPKVVHQMGTAVRPEHRGHALGKWLKAAMIQRVLDGRRDSEEIRTGNADSNDAMLGINKQLGFKPHIASTLWQVSLERVRAYLASS